MSMRWSSKRVAERHLALQQRLVIGLRHFGRRGQILEMHQVLVRATRRYGRSVAICALDLLVFDDAALLGVDQEHAARLQAALAHDVLGREVEHAGFGGHDDQVVLGDVVARRAQAVAIEHRADAACRR